MTSHLLKANKTNKGILLLSLLMIFTILLTACGGTTAAQKKNQATTLTMLGNAGGDYPQDFNPYNPSVISGTPGLIYETLQPPRRYGEALVSFEL